MKKIPKQAMTKDEDIFISVLNFYYIDPLLENS